MRRMAILLFLVVLGPPEANGATYWFRDYCSLQAESDRILRVKIISGADVCGERECFASVYDAAVLAGPNNDPSPEIVKFATSTPIQLGQQYVLFADKLGDGERSIGFRGAGYETTYTVADSVNYYVPMDGAFQVAGDRYYRAVWPGCEGEVAECSQFEFPAGVVRADVQVSSLKDLEHCQASVKAGH